MVPPSRAPVSAFSSFTYDGVFNLTGFSANYGTGGTLPNGSRSFGYDTKDRLTSSSIPTSSTTTVSSTFGFDSAGNRTGVNSTTIPFNADNQCSSTGYSFDGNGNPTSYNGTSLSFDPENRVTAIGSANSATYRADGLRASKTIGSAKTYFLYDGGEPIIELSSSGTVTALNVFAPDGLVARTVGTTTTQYVFDQQGNVADRTDGFGASQSVTQYDAWGNEQAISGTPSDPFGYNAQSGYYLDRDTGLYLCQHRFYDPANGRWLNRDPIGYVGGTNLYGYCAGGPIRAADPSGLKVFLGFDWTLQGIGEGLATGLHAVGHPFGLGDDGSWDDRPGYGTSKVLAGVGYGVAAVAGGVAAGTALAGSAGGTAGGAGVAGLGASALGDGGAAGGAGGSGGWTQVGRVMCPEEYGAMQESGLVQASRGAEGGEVTWGTSPPMSPAAGGYQPQIPGDGFVTFSVPSGNVVGAGGPNGWANVVDGNSRWGQALGLPPGMPRFIDLGPFGGP